jgi:hypothetical protein
LDDEEAISDRDEELVVELVVGLSVKVAGGRK